MYVGQVLTIIGALPFVLSPFPFPHFLSNAGTICWKSWDFPTFFTSSLGSCSSTHNRSINGLRVIVVVAVPFFSPSSFLPLLYFFLSPSLVCPKKSTILPRVVYHMLYFTYRPIILSLFSLL
ncbi:hypothetical protein F5X96DRAFT_404275 [Biscogniauxia mediterranea]|nr:hypothetical protein F5X96DRAFT_404275 [Biscogniauxia mediterranea]